MKIINGDPNKKHTEYDISRGVHTTNQHEQINNIVKIWNILVSEVTLKIETF